MTHLRQIMLEELQRRNYTENTTRFCIRIVEDFSRRFNRPPDRLCEQAAARLRTLHNPNDYPPVDIL